MKTIYANNQVEITADIMDNKEAKININCENLIWIETSKIHEFEVQLKALLDYYRI